jgi:uncharacterized membrane-anchored protein
MPERGAGTGESFRKGRLEHRRGYGILTAMATGEVQGRLTGQAVLAATKVPLQITVWFWLTKILSTGMGEAFADWMNFSRGPFFAGAVGTVILVVAMVLQFRSRRYNTWIYWFAVVAVSIWGTLAADGMHIELHVPYAYSSAFYAAALTLIFVVWYLTERTLSIHSINTPRREVFYWAAVLATFALGTALGDFSAITLKLGFFSSGVLFAVVIAVPAIAYRGFGLNPVLAFWAAYTVTRPLGASFADWMGVTHRLGGLGWGRGPVSIYMTIPIIALVAFMAISKVDMDPPDSLALPRRPAARHRAA